MVVRKRDDKGFFKYYANFKSRARNGQAYQAEIELVVVKGGISFNSSVMSG